MLRLKKKASPGFTLIELLIITTILTITFSAGFAGFRDYSRRQQLEGLARQLRGDLSLSLTKALSGTKPTIAACNPPNTLQGYGIQVVAGGLSYNLYVMCAGSPNPSTTDTRTLPIGYTISRAPAVPANAYFKVLGQGTSIPSGEIVYTLTHTPTAKAVTVTMTSSGEIK